MPTPYEQKIIKAFKFLCQKNGGASPHEVTEHMAEMEWLSPADSVIDIEGLMQELRKQGEL